MSHFVYLKTKDIQFNMIINDKKWEISTIGQPKTAFSAILHEKVLKQHTNYQNSLIPFYHLPNEAEDARFICLTWDFTCPGQVGNPYC